MHAVSFLSARIYELHDRDQFEVFGFDYSIDEQSVWRKRILDGMDQVFPIHDLSDEEAAKLIQSKEIDILFDMVGLTSGGRPGIFMYRPAPIQVHYLGFLGPVGIDEIDYMVCDEYVVPPPLAPFMAPNQFTCLFIKLIIICGNTHPSRSARPWAYQRMRLYFAQLLIHIKSIRAFFITGCIFCKERVIQCFGCLRKMIVSKQTS
jgi:hypothetical protein